MQADRRRPHTRWACGRGVRVPRPAAAGVADTMLEVWMRALRRSAGRAVGCGGARRYRILTARAANSTRISKEMSAWSIINSLARCVSGKTSVGLNAVAVLYPRKR